MPKEFYLIAGAVIAGVVSVFTTFINPRLANWKDKKEFKRKYNYDQLKELYLSLYSIVVQSEYVRYFSKKYFNTLYDIREVPFIELVETRTTVKNGVITKEEIKNAVSEFDKKAIVTKIICKSEYASQRLLKLAVAYRYAHANYQKRFDDPTILDNFQIEEVRLIFLIVQTIVKECNEMLEECNMPFDGKEISYGILNDSVFDEYSRY